MIKGFSCRFVSVLLSLLVFFASCISAKKLDAYVASEFNNKLPKADKKNDSSVLITSPIPSDPDIISVTEKKVKNLPLILYWKYDYRHTCVLNPAIGISYFKKTISQQAAKLKQKLNGQQLELSVEQIPGSFAIVDKGHILLLMIHWHKLYVDPGTKDLIVSYKVRQNGAEVKSGKIIIPNTEGQKGIRFAQSWKSSSSEFLSQYNLDITEMSKAFVNKLIAEL